MTWVQLLNWFNFKYAFSTFLISPFRTQVLLVFVRIGIELFSESKSGTGLDK